MRLALTELFHAKWTEQIHDEWIRNVLIKRPDLNKTQLERTRQLMNAHVLDALVTGYEDLIPSLTLPDPNDRHVLAAAIQGRVDVIVTFNLSDFPDNQLKSHGIEAQHPDHFLSQLLDLDFRAVCDAIKQQRAALRHPEKSASALLDILEKQSLSQSIARLRSAMEWL